MWKDPERMRRIEAELAQVKNKLGEKGAASRVAALACEMIEAGSKGAR